MSVDWIGDGTAPGGVGIVPGGRFPIRAVFGFETSDSFALQLAVEERLKSFPELFPIVSDKEHTSTFEGEHYFIYLTTATMFDGEPAVTIWFETVDNDGRAAEILTPIAEALGTLP